MYIWIGCALPKDFEKELRQQTLPLAQTLGLGLEPFALPQHISLKISFDAGERTEEILAAVEQLLTREQAFAVHPVGIARQENILWISFRESETLSRLHNLLDHALCQRFGIAQHVFDRAFQFHTTIYMGEETAIARAERLLRNLPLPEALPVRRFLLGVSPTGAAGTYRVVREIAI